MVTLFNVNSAAREFPFQGARQGLAPWLAPQHPSLIESAQAETMGLQLEHQPASGTRADDSLVFSFPSRFVSVPHSPQFRAISSSQVSAVNLRQWHCSLIRINKFLRLVRQSRQELKLKDDPRVYFCGKGHLIQLHILLGRVGAINAPWA